MRPRLRLPLRFDATQMLLEVRKIKDEEWVRHFNKDEYSGRWDGLALLAPGGDATKIYPGATDTGVYQRTPVLERCSYLGEVLDTFKCGVLSARLLRLAPGAKIHEHRDYDLGLDLGRLRIHIPIQTGNDVRFVVGDHRVLMAPGETWYMDFGLLHRVDNDGTSDRIHLVIDCVNDEWLQALMARAMDTEPPESIDAESGSRRDPVDIFRELLVSNPALGASLHECSTVDEFVDLSLRVARDQDIHVARPDIELALRNTMRGGAKLSLSEAPPLTHWVPEHVSEREGATEVQWCFLASRPLQEPFFEDTMIAARRTFFNRFLRPTTSFEALEHAVSEQPGLPLVGIIAHVSRCGSTLMAQMLATVPSLVVASEPPPLDSVIRETGPEITHESHIRRIRALVSALSQPRRGGETGFVLKLDSWHLSAMPLLRGAFPDAPVVLSYRDPSEVLASHTREPGLQMSGCVGQPYSGIPMEGQTQLEYRAQIVGLLFAAALRAAPGALLVHYKDLPDFVHTRVSSHFGLVLSDGDHERMRARERFGAKSAGQLFDVVTKRNEAARIEAGSRDQVERWAGSAYRELERMRASQAVTDRKDPPPNASQPARS